MGSAIIVIQPGLAGNELLNKECLPYKRVRGVLSSDKFLGRMGEHKVIFFEIPRGIRDVSAIAPFYLSSE